MNISIITAYDNDLLIGSNNSLCYYIPDDLKNFKKITTNVTDCNKKNAIIMGRNTWESLPIKPLPNRINCIISSKKNTENVLIFSSLEECIHNLSSNKNIENIFIIGGGQLYHTALLKNIVDKVYLTRIYHSQSTFETCPQNDKVYFPMFSYKSINVIQPRQKFNNIEYAFLELIL